MIECCRFGNVRLVHSLLSPISTANIVDTKALIVESIFGRIGCFIITFEDKKAADRCVKEMNGFTFTGNYRLIVHGWNPDNIDFNKSAAVHSEDISEGLQERSIPDNISQNEGENEKIRKEAEDVEEFLNSLL